MDGRWDMSTSSVHTWRQLQGYPDFQRHLGHPHPWHESLCVAYTGAMIPNLPAAMVFRKEYGWLTVQHLERKPLVNPKNPYDHLLAGALWRHFSNEPIHVAPQVDALYSLLAGSKDIVGALLSLAALEKYDPMDIDTAVFEYSP